MKCPECGDSTTRGKIEKVRVLSKPEKFEIDVIVISCVHCRRTVGVVNVPLRYSAYTAEILEKLVG